MNLKREVLVDAMEAFSAFALKEIPAKAAARAAKLCRLMNAEHKDYAEAHRKLVQKYGVEIEDPERKGRKLLKVKDENIAAYDAEHKAMLEDVVELPGCQPVAWADVEHLKLAPAMLADLIPHFIEEPK